jgi:hypothetical protein
MSSILLNGADDRESTAASSNAGTARNSTHGTYLLLVLIACWLAAIGYGVHALRDYESTPGAAGASPPVWPESSHILRDPHRGSLIMLIHPQCSRTGASLDELAAVMKQMDGRVSAWVLVAQPLDMPGSPARTATWSRAQHIPGVIVVPDPAGTEARRFGAQTSGHVVLYDRTGHLRFSGGITAARGHTGDNLGRQRLLEFLRGRVGGSGTHEVYGCPL